MTLIPRSSASRQATWLYPGTALALAAHGLTAAALHRFNAVAGGYPVLPAGAAVYTAVVVGALALLFAAGRRPSRSLHDDSTLLLLSLPAAVTVVLQSTLWVVPWLGDAPFAPFDLGDDDTVMTLCLLFAGLWIAVALLYGSYRYLAAGALFQLAAYATHALSHWYRFPQANPLGVQPDFPFMLLALFAVGALLVRARRQLFEEHCPPLWVAALLLTGMAMFVLVETLGAFPGNGMALGWRTPVHFVPLAAWDWSYTGAIAVARLAVIAVVISGFAVYVIGNPAWRMNR